MNTGMIWIWRLTLGLAALVLSWRMLITGMAEYFHEQGPEAVEQSLAWNPGHADALTTKAETLLESDPLSAIDLARKALQLNPADGLAAIVLAQALLRNEQPEKAD